MKGRSVTPMVVMLLHTVSAPLYYVLLWVMEKFQECIIRLNMCDGVLPLWISIIAIRKKEERKKTHTLKVHYQMKSVVLALLNLNSLMLIHNDPSCREKNKLMKAKYYSAFICSKQMAAKWKGITYTLSSLYGFILIAAIITPTFPLYNEVN